MRESDRVRLIEQAEEAARHWAKLAAVWTSTRCDREAAKHYADFVVWLRVWLTRRGNSH